MLGRILKRNAGRAVYTRLFYAVAPQEETLKLS